MPDFLKSAFTPSAEISATDVALRLIIAVLLGGAVAWVYRRARGPAASQGSFPGTLVLLAVLIAMVTQVIGDNVARAFSLVGALSIVRFRTVVRDTQDTAYVIFAVVVGMAVGAHNLWVAGLGLIVVAVAAWLVGRTTGSGIAPTPAWLLAVRLGLGPEPETLLGATLDSHLAKRTLISIETARQGAALDLVYEVRLGGTAEALLREVHRLEGVQGASLKLRGADGE
ncbi:MAG: DUF4956 domain-containing protein [Opitutaceae bacterium]